MTKNCKKCGGTGFLNWTAVDGGRCWSCQGIDARFTTSAPMTDAERQARWQAHCDELKAARRARRTEQGA